jgi:hypothetical protein
MRFPFRGPSNKRAHASRIGSVSVPKSMSVQPSPSSSSQELTWLISPLSGSRTQ